MDKIIVYVDDSAFAREHPSSTVQRVEIAMQPLKSTTWV